jgi:4-aminobutyrate aminotransferase/(S)-3-amino-2-methylpropionate transaminase
MGTGPSAETARGEAATAAASSALLTATGDVAVATVHRRLVTEIPGPAARRLAERRSAAVAAGVASSVATYVDHAEGAIVTDVDGNELIDLGAGIAVVSVGHTAPAVVSAVTAQATRLVHSCFMVTPYEPYVAVCEQLNELTPGRHAKRSALFNSGAEAVENAVKIARRATGRQAVVVFDHAYHGRTNLTMALTAKNAPYKDGFGPFAPEVYRMPMSYPYRDPVTMSGAEAAKRATDRIASEVGAERVACVVIEPIQGEGGFVVPAPGFLPALGAWCAAHGVLFVADEVQSGFCRTGDWFACEHEGIVPDLVTTAKGIAGGMPLAGVTGRAELMDAVPPGGLGGTFGGNPIACAAALGAIETMRSLDLCAAARSIGTIVAEALGELAERSPAIGELRGRGAMQAIELVVPGTREPDAAATRHVARHCHKNGVIVLTCGTDSNVIRLIPPLTIPAPVLIEGLEVLAEALAPLG